MSTITPDPTLPPAVTRLDLGVELGVGGLLTIRTKSSIWHFVQLEISTVTDSVIKRVMLDTNSNLMRIVAPAPSTVAMDRTIIKNTKFAFYIVGSDKVYHTGAVIAAYINNVQRL